MTDLAYPPWGGGGIPTHSCCNNNAAIIILLQDKLLLQDKFKNNIWYHDLTIILQQCSIMGIHNNTEVRA